MSAVTNKSGLQPRRHSKLYWALADGWVLAKRNLVQIPRIPELLVFAIIQPVMFVLLFCYVFGGAIDVGGESYVNYLMAGIFVQTVAFGAVSTGIGLLRRPAEGARRQVPLASHGPLRCSYGTHHRRSGPQLLRRTRDAPRRYRRWFPS